MSIVSTFFIRKITCTHTVLGREWIFLIVLSFIQTIIILWSLSVLTRKRSQHERTVSAERASVGGNELSKERTPTPSSTSEEAYGAINKSGRSSSNVSSSSGEFLEQPGGTRRKSSLGLKDNNEDMCLSSQIYSLALFYVIADIADIMLYVLGFESIEQGNLICTYNQRVIIVWNELGALYTFFNSATILFYSWVMFQVFYRIPVKYNTVTFQRLGVKKINANQTVSTSLTEQDDQLNQFIQVDKEQEIFQQKINQGGKPKDSYLRSPLTFSNKKLFSVRKSDEIAGI